MGIFDASMSNGGSVNSASSWMQTNATDARAWSEQQAAVAFERQKELQKMAQDFNAIEAQKARDFNSAEAMKAAEWNATQASTQRQWQTDMANSIYTRSVKNMREAGINPILAANMGLSGANVGSGATASISPASGSGASVGAGSAPLAQNFMDTASASQSSGSSWSHSESGLVTALSAMGAMISSALGAINSAHQIDINMSGLTDWLGITNSPGGKGNAPSGIATQNTQNAVSNMVDKVVQTTKQGMDKISGRTPTGKGGARSYQTIKFME